jgi:hypothetical protein
MCYRSRIPFDRSLQLAVPFLLQEHLWSSRECTSSGCNNHSFHSVHARMGGPITNSFRNNDDFAAQAISVTGGEGH